MPGVDDILCDYCNEPTDLLTGDEVYRGRGDLSHKYFYVCKPCDAWVGCHPGSMRPLGRLANYDLRQAKKRAHAAFDPLWKRKIENEGCKKRTARNAGYQWLADQLSIDVDDCHIGMFDEEKCRKVVEVCLPYSQGQHA